MQTTGVVILNGFVENLHLQMHERCVYTLSSTTKPGNRAGFFMAAANVQCGQGMRSRFLASGVKQGRKEPLSGLTSAKRGYLT